MLVLSRKVGERIQIGDNITVVINRVAGNRVTIGIEAPGEMRIVRSELQVAAEEDFKAEEFKPEEFKVEEPVGAKSRISLNDFIASPLAGFSGRRPR